MWTKPSTKSVWNEMRLGGWWDVRSCFFTIRSGRYKYRTIVQNFGPITAKYGNTVLLSANAKFTQFNYVCDAHGDHKSWSFGNRQWRTFGKSATKAFLQTDNVAENVSASAWVTVTLLWNCGCHSVIGNHVGDSRDSRLTATKSFGLKVYHLDVVLQVHQCIITEY